MIPITEEEQLSRHPFFEVYAAWGGNLALDTGLVGCTASASSAHSDYPATNVNDGDKTLLNDSWWESTKTSGKSFYETTELSIRP